MTVLQFLHDFGPLVVALVVILALILWAAWREATGPSRRDDDDDPGFEANEETRGADELPVKPSSQSQSRPRPKEPPPRNRRAP